MSFTLMNFYLLLLYRNKIDPLNSLGTPCCFPYMRFLDCSVYSLTTLIFDRWEFYFDADYALDAFLVPVEYNSYYWRVFFHLSSIPPLSELLHRDEYSKN